MMQPWILNLGIKHPLVALGSPMIDSTSFKHVFAVLAHDEPDCVQDLLVNLGKLDPNSKILLYDGSRSRGLIKQANRWHDLNSDVVSISQEKSWGRLLGFAIDCINHLQGTQYDAITFVDSDQLLLRPGYSSHISKSVQKGFGVMSVHPYRQGADSNILAVRDFHAEQYLWQRYLSRFSNWQNSFVRWTFWPGTALSSEAATEIAKEVESPAFREVFDESRAWATEECIIPTVSSLLGYSEIANPCDREWCRYKTPWTVSDVVQALEVPNAYFIHPVPRQIANPVRSYVRSMYGL